MSTYTLTKNGAIWMANKLCDSLNTPNITVMYLIYSNGGTEQIELTSDFSIESLDKLPSDTWYVKKTGGIVPYVYTSDNGTVYATISGVFSSSDVTAYTNKPVLSVGSKIVAIASGYINAQGKDIIVSASNLDPSSKIQWTGNMSMSFTCPIAISPYPEISK